MKNCNYSAYVSKKLELLRYYCIFKWPQLGSFRLPVTTIVRRGHDSELPQELTQYKEAPAFYGIVGEIIRNHDNLPEEWQTIACEMALAVQRIIDNRKKRDWPTMEDVTKDMQNDLDDYLFDLEDNSGLQFSTEEMDAIIDRCISIAKKLAGHGV